jgi:DnaJ family protein C protein 11
LIQRRQEALDAQELMKETIGRKSDSESNGGLIIVSAFYGRLPRARANKPPKELVLDDCAPYSDFTIVLQTMVVESKLHIAGGHTKANLLGFFDPCLGEEKRLRVSYRFKNQLHVIEVDDESELLLPLRSHRVD